MSYDLVFWRQSDPALNPGQIYNSLLSGDRVTGLLELPIEQFLAKLMDQFPGSVREPNGATEWQVWEGPPGEGGVLEIYWSDQHVLGCCRGLSGEQMNKIVDVGLAFNCPLFDPQTGERFAP